MSSSKCKKMQGLLVGWPSKAHHHCRITGPQFKSRSNPIQSNPFLYTFLKKLLRHGPRGKRRELPRGLPNPTGYGKRKHCLWPNVTPDAPPVDNEEIAASNMENPPLFRFRVCACGEMQAADADRWKTRYANPLQMQDAVHDSQWWQHKKYRVRSQNDPGSTARTLSRRERPNKKSFLLPARTFFVIRGQTVTRYAHDSVAPSCHSFCIYMTVISFICVDRSFSG